MLKVKKELWQGVCSLVSSVMLLIIRPNLDRLSHMGRLTDETKLMSTNLSGFVPNRTVGTIKGIPETFKIVPRTLFGPFL